MPHGPPPDPPQTPGAAVTGGCGRLLGAQQRIPGGAAGLILTVRGVRGAVGAAGVLLQGQVAVGVAVVLCVPGGGGGCEGRTQWEPPRCAHRQLSPDALIALTVLCVRSVQEPPLLCRHAAAVQPRVLPAGDSGDIPRRIPP